MLFEGIPVGPIIALLVGASITIYGVVLRDRVARTRAWAAAPGVVSHSGLAEQSRTDADGLPSRTFGPDVRYDYTVGGREYRGRRLGLVETGASFRGYAEGVAARYPVGRPVTVYYDPADPRESVLERTAGPAITLAALGLAVMAGALAWGWVAAQTA